MGEKGEIKTFRDLIVWQKAHEMDCVLLNLSPLSPESSLFGS